MIDARLPRMEARARSSSSRRLCPSKVILPETTAGGSASSLRIEYAVTDLPQPLSPARPTVSPSKIEKLTPSTELTGLSPPMNRTLRLSTSSSCGPGSIVVTVFSDFESVIRLKGSVLRLRRKKVAGEVNLLLAFVADLSREFD